MQHFAWLNFLPLCLKRDDLQGSQRRSPHAIGPAFIVSLATLRPLMPDWGTGDCKGCSVTSTQCPLSPLSSWESYRASTPTPFVRRDSQHRTGTIDVGFYRLSGQLDVFDRCLLSFTLVLVPTKWERSNLCHKGRRGILPSV